jgi:hypothetical protein
MRTMADIHSFPLSTLSVLQWFIKTEDAIEKRFQHREYVASDGGAIHEYGTQWPLPIDVLSMLFCGMSEESCRKACQ